jgi:hypothetical protein
MRIGGVSTLLLAVLAAAQNPPRHRSFTLTGQVVDGLSGRPMTNLELGLDRDDWQPAAERAAPDSQGRFAFRGLPAGEYILSATGADFGTIHFEEVADPGWVITIRLGPEEEEKVVQFRIVPRGVISGTVKDEFGEPLERAPVTLYRPAWTDGRVVFGQVNQQTTDDRGRYRMTNLPPGGYVICAGASQGQATPVPLPGPVDFAAPAAPRFYVRSCYPDAAGPSPTPFPLAAAGRVAVDLTLRSAPAVSVEGRLSDPPANAGLSIRLIPESAFDFSQTWFAAVKPPEFGFHGVPPGSYRLEADVTWQEPDGSQRSAVARLRIAVGNVNLGGVYVPLEPAGAIDVVLHPADGARIDPGSVQVGLRPTDSDPNGMRWAQGDETGPLHLSGLARGAYWLSTRTKGSYCVTSAKFGGQDVLRRVLTVTPAMAASLDLVVSKSCGGIQARVVSEGKPVPKAKVLLMLSGSARDPGDLMTDFSNDEGEITFTGLAPGRYLLWAWGVDTFGGFVGPESLDGEQHPATQVMVTVGDPTRVDVPLLKPEVR